MEQNSVKKILIIYPHWPPSNLAGVHRARLIANFARNCNWQVTVLTVFPRYYEESPDWDLLKTVSRFVEVIHVRAIPVLPFRLIGDIGLRAFFHLLIKALSLIRSGQYSFVWIPIPSFYTSLLGPILHLFTGIRYGIDYIDPWVRDISNRKNLRATLSQWMARMLEPIALSRVRLVSGVSQKYFEPALLRNKKMHIQTVAMPYGFDMADHSIKLEELNMPWKSGEQPIVYAGAFLPNSGLFLTHLFAVVARLHQAGKWPVSRKFYFLGTGKYIHKSITQYAQEAGIAHLVIEVRDRFPYLHILNFLAQAWRILVLGSTEEHYTASKIFQVILSNRPCLAIFHYKSSAVEVLNQCNASEYCITYSPSEFQAELFQQHIENALESIMQEISWNPELAALHEYSAEISAKMLFESIERIN